MGLTNHIYKLLIGYLLLQSSVTQAQKENALIRSGNQYYRQKQIDQSLQQYEKALKKAPNNPTANYNMGNSEFRKNKFSDAAKSYDLSISNSPDKAVQEKGQYNKGVAQIKDQKLEESIGSWENALKLDPQDEDARENLEKALMEQKKNQPPKEQKKDKDPKKNKDQENKKQPDQENKKQPDQQNQQQSKLTKQQVEQLLNALQQKEKEVQDKMNQSKVKSLKQPEKDW